MEWLKDPFIIFIIPCILFLFVSINRRRKLPLPPGPPGLPIIGNMLMIEQLTHRGLARLSDIYGGIFHLRLGFLHAITISTPEMARQVLQVHDITFSNRPATIATTYLTYDRADLVFAHYGQFWRQMRKLLVMKLFSCRRTESWASVRDNVRSTVKTVAAGKIGSPINLFELASNLTKDITFRAAFGAQISVEDQDVFISILQEFSKLFGAFNIGDFIPCLKWMDLNGINKRMKKARKTLDRFIDGVIDEHLANPKEADAPDADMVDDMLTFLVEADGGGKIARETADPQGFLGLTRDNIKGIIMDIMFGGTETVASAIEWTMAELMKNPEDMKLVQQELTDVVGIDRLVNESDLDRLSYLKCVIKETLRLHPPFPLLLHEAAENCEVAGYFIPKQSRVMVNVWAIGRDKFTWTDPESFKPGRFAPDHADGASIDFKGNFFELLPFGSGRRSCPGMQLGMYALELAMANLMHTFNWTLPNGMNPSDLDMGDVFGLKAPKAVQLVVVPSLRLNCPIV